MKKIHRFLVTDITETETVTLTDNRIVFHIGNVLKLNPGEEIILFTDGSADYHFRIESVSKKEIVLKKESLEPVPFAPRTVIAAVAMVKKDLFELIVQKLTEIGVTTIVPLTTDRTIKQSVRVDRLQLISDEALELSGGTKRVHITEPMKLDACIKLFPYQHIYFEQHAQHTLRDIAIKNTVVLYIGPEGGWSEQERGALDTHATGVTLGYRTLRAETASIVAAYQVLWSL